MTRRATRALLTLLLVAGVHVVAPTRVAAELRMVTTCASHCGKARSTGGCAPRCCVVADASSVATLAPAAQVERPAVALVVPLAPAALAAPIAEERSTHLDGSPGAGPPVWLSLRELRL